MYELKDYQNIPTNQIALITTISPNTILHKSFKESTT